MLVELDRTDIVNILTALNAIQVRGKDNLVGVLRLMEKLETALTPAEPAKASGPSAGEPAKKEPAA